MQTEAVVTPTGIARVACTATLAALISCASGCLVVLDPPTLYSTPADAAAHDAFTSDAEDHAFDAGADIALDAQSPEVVTPDDVQRADHPIDAPSDVVNRTEAGEASLIDAVGGFVGPAAASCALADSSPSRASYVGTTCDGMDLANLSCNSGAHREVVIRIDGMPGQVWDITPSAGLAYALHLGTSCSNAPLVCGSGSVDGGGMISDGPFPTTRTDYFVFESMSPTACGPYSVAVTLR